MSDVMYVSNKRGRCDSQGYLINSQTCLTRHHLYAVRARLLRHGSPVWYTASNFISDRHPIWGNERMRKGKRHEERSTIIHRGIGGGFQGRKWDYRGRLVAARTTVNSSASIVPTGFASTARVGLSAWTACRFLSRCTTESKKPQFRMRKRDVW